MSTTPGYKKKLIEVALPLDEINKQSAREKSIRHGHPSTLHLWWARRPLAACRAVLFAQLVDDPSARPDEFPTTEDQARERKRLFKIIKRLADWKNINDRSLYEEAHREILKSCNGNPPPILDPFAGGGSIPLEAQRLGLESHASDLNPVPVIINKALIELPARWAGTPPVFPDIASSRFGDWPGASGLAEDIRHYGQWICNEAGKRIGNLFPKAKLKDGTEANVIAWIWARTVTCPNPACQGSMPLVRSFWLGRKSGKERYIEPIIKGNNVYFDIRGPEGTPRNGTVSRTGAICIICNTPTPLDYIRTEGKAGRMGSQLMAVAAEGPRMRYYLPPDDEHEKAADVPRPNDVPEGEIPFNPRYLTTPNYGMSNWSDLFTNRQLTSLTTFSDLVIEAHSKVIEDAQKSTYFKDPGYAEEYADAVATYLGLAVTRIIDRHSNVGSWDSSPSKEQVRGVFARQAIAMCWDFAEGNPLSESSGNISESFSWISRVLDRIPANKVGIVQQADAAKREYRNVVISTDPPYYDNVGYADLSDFFYVWLRRSLRSAYPNLLGTMLTPKAEEIVADPVRRGSKLEANRYFEDSFQKVFIGIRESGPTDYPITVFYAFKQSESDESGEASTGWETLLEGMIRSGWSITATWPVRTELKNRMRSFESNALASSIVLACRPRSEDIGAIDRRSLINELKSELPHALRDLQQGGIAPVDLAQAAIGPGMSIFSRYSRVTEPDGTPMRVRTALILINQILAEILSEQEGDFDPDTRFCIKWFENHSFDIGDYGQAETLSKAMDTSVNGLHRAGVLKMDKGKVQLLSPAELPARYDPTLDDRIPVWEIVMHLAKRLREQGVDSAAQLMAAAKNKVDLNIAKELTYLLYSICEKRKWAETGLLFNDLGTTWLEIEKESHTAITQGIINYPEED